MRALSDYRTLVFDCDGVILNSNRIKTEAFYRTALPFGEEVAQQLVNYHVANGGVSRYKKFAYLLESLLAEETIHADISSLLSDFSHFTRAGLQQCEVAPGLRELRAITTNTRWLVVSGGDQDELRDVFHQCHLSDFFDGGIFGSPDTKETILERELIRHNISEPALFMGDSLYDHQAASHAGLDFLFISQWSEFGDWRNYCQHHSIQHTPSISHIINKLASHIQQS